MNVNGVYHYNEFSNLLVVSNKIPHTSLTLWLGNKLNHPFLMFSSAHLLSGAKTGKLGNVVLPTSSINLGNGNYFILLSNDDDLTIFKLSFPYENVEDFNNKLVDDLDKL